ncbi:uncharacterized protein LOC116136526 [Pistacia vera]|uniref:uncharacterized protein LOC116136526 n=1 Tax=Pistacia vera TaxID=55513 RepID=UPI0012635A74|nr:uncharacterized protein LOC116136526 [Pistacia vera]
MEKLRQLQARVNSELLRLQHLENRVVQRKARAIERLRAIESSQNDDAGQAWNMRIMEDTEVSMAKIQAHRVEGMSIMKSIEDSITKLNADHEVDILADAIQRMRNEEDEQRREGKFRSKSQSLIPRAINPEGRNQTSRRGQALLSMQLSLEKVRLGAAKEEVAPKEENATLKRGLEAAKAERNLSFESANRYLSERDAALRTVDFQKAELEKHAEKVKELQRTIVRLSKEVGERDQELKTTSLRASQAEQEKDASEKQRKALEAELQAS